MATKEFIINDEMKKAAQGMVCGYYERDKYYRALSTLINEAFAANPWCNSCTEYKNGKGVSIYGSNLSHAEKAQIRKLFNDALNKLVSSTIETLKGNRQISSSFTFRRKNDYYGAGLPPSTNNKTL